MPNFTPQRHLTGGLRLPARKERSTTLAIRRGHIPRVLYVSTRQHRGHAARPIVKIGQRVLRGQKIARMESAAGADVHAPTSGTVSAIEPHEVCIGTDVTIETCIVIDTDGNDTPDGESGPIDPAVQTEDIVAQLVHAGIVGLGGAVYPTAAKIDLVPNRHCRLLIINGAECEPYISCDDMLMRESPQEVLDGAEILQRLVGAERGIVAIERDKPQAIDAITDAARERGSKLSIAELPSIYPAGGERQLVDVLGGIEVPSDRLPGELGILCQNVGTAYAVHRYYRHGEPLTSRVVTVTGSGVAEPRNVLAMIGTPIADLIDDCGGYQGKPVALIHGGSMMGLGLENDRIPMTKSTNCIIVAETSELVAERSEWPCIRCGECAIACPARLQPQELLVAARQRNAGGLIDLALSECIECGCCDVVCPSHIPLTQIFREAKPLVRRYDEQQQFSSMADERYRMREQRRQEMLQAETRQREAIKQSLDDEDRRTQEIRLAVERARKHKSQADGD